MKKRVLSLILALALLIGALPGQVLAAQADDTQLPTDQSVCIETSLDASMTDNVYQAQSETLALRVRALLGDEPTAHTATLDDQPLTGEVDEDGWTAYTLTLESGSHTLCIEASGTQQTRTLVYQPASDDVPGSDEPTNDAPVPTNGTSVPTGDTPVVGTSVPTGDEPVPASDPTTPTGGDAAQGVSVGKVRVIVENNTASPAPGGGYGTWEEGATQWSGTLVDKQVDIYSNSTAMTAIAKALEGHSVTGADLGYISAIDGLENGWMFTLNDWFIAEGIDMYTVENGTLKNGDVIRGVYTVTYGPDVGSVYNSSDKKLASLTVTDATLNPTFAGAKSDYELVIGDVESKSITLTPTATNKNFLACVFQGAMTLDEAKALGSDTWYTHTSLLGHSPTLTVKPGDVLTVVVGAPNWPSMSNGVYGCYAENVDPCVYKLTVTQTATDLNAGFNNFFTALTGVATVTNDETYPFSVTDDGSALMSTNAGVGNSNAGITLTFQKAAKLTFSYKASSEGGAYAAWWDYLDIRKKGADETTYTSLKKDGSKTVTEFTEYAVEMQSGESLQLAYVKDNATDGGDDCVYLKDFTVTLPKTVTFHANDGTDTTSQQTLFGATALTANTFTRAGYRFDGWAMSRTGAVEYLDGATFTPGETDTDLYAVWTKVWNVTFPNMPEGAAITVKQGGTELAASETANTWILPDGTYTYTAELFGYVSATDVTFTVNGADLPVQHTLQSAAKTTVTFSITGAAVDTAVTVTVINSESTTMSAKDGTALVYELPAGEYTYSVSAKGYKKIKNQSLTVASGTTEKTVPVTLEVSYVWEGDVAESLTKSGDVYQIGTGAQLAKFAALVNGGEPAARGMLTADIILNDADEMTNVWTSIGTKASPFTGSLNGGGHTISGLYQTGTDAAVGLFGYIGAGGEVTNLTIENASVKSTKSSDAYAGLVAASNEGSITSVKLVSSKVSGGYVVGGIAGFNKGTVSGCANESADVEQNTAKDQGVGGIVGKNDANGLVSVCYNKAHIIRGHSSKDYAYLGGIVGQNYSSSSTVDSCYNHGQVDLAYKSGGLVGNASGTVKNSYSTGTVPSGKKALIGNGSATVTNCYYLDSCGATDTKGTAKTATEFKTLAASLGGAFEDTDTTPRLKWENPSATFSITLTVKPANAVVTVGSLSTPTPAIDETAGTATYSFSNLAKGEYAWSVVCNAAAEDDFESQSGTFSLATSDITRTVTLEKKQYDVEFNLTPANASFTLKEAGVEDAAAITPKTALDETGKVVYSLPMGSYTYTATAFGYNDATDTVTVAKSTGLTAQSVTLTQKTNYQLTFTGLPADASITVTHADGGIQTPTGTGVYNLVPETYSYTIKKAGFKTVKGEVTITNEAQTIDITLTALTPWDGSVATGFADGEGTQEKPYEIETAEQLAYLAQQVNSSSSVKSSTYILLTADIDLDNKPFTPIGNSSSYPFAGQFDGNGHTIKNLSVTGTDASNIGLFGRVSGSVKNLTLTNATISASASSSSYVGALVGYCNGTLENCLVKNSTVTAASYNSVGGLVGETNKKLTRCAVQGVSVSGKDNVGGVVGKTSQAVENCYATRVNVTASGAYAGGVLGCTSSYNAVSKVFARGTVQAADYAGGLIGGRDSDWSNVSLNTAYAVVDVTATAENGTYGALGSKSVNITDSNTFYCSSSTLTGATEKTGGTAKTLAELKSETILTSLGTQFALYSATDGLINAGFPYLTAAPGNDKVIPAQLTAPTITWSDKTAGWSTIANAQGYQLVLTKGETTLFNDTLTATSKDFTTIIDLGGSGSYTLSVTALGDGDHYMDSTAATASQNFTISSGSVTFTVSAGDGKTFYEGDPQIILTMADGKTTQTLTSGEAKTLPLGTYSYTVKATTFQTQTGSFTLTVGGYTKALTLQYSSKWDGKTAIEPQLDEANNVYLIYNGYELAWFRDEVNKSNSNYGLSAKLMDNIDLDGHDWKAIATFNSYNGNGYTGTFDGNNKTISNLKPVANEAGKGAGLFGCVAANGIVKNLTVSGTLSAVQYCGGIAACLNAGKIENCVNQLNISTPTGAAPTLYAGGVAGYTHGAAVITGCRNEGTINGGGSNYVGGIAGSTHADSSVTNCENSAAVSGAGRIGGIAGQNGAALTACYNCGNVTGTKNIVGGIAGFANNNTITNCFNAASVTGDKEEVGGIVGELYNKGTYAGGLSGCLNTGSVCSTDTAVTTVGALVGAEQEAPIKYTKNSYFLAGTCTQGIGANSTDADETTSVTADQLASKRLIAQLGGAFASVAGTAAPVLRWQNAAAMSVVAFDLTPSGASVTVTGQTAVTGEAGVYVLDNGEYSYTVSCENYTSQTGSLTVSDASQLISVELSVLTYAVTFNVQPAGAKITVKNAEDETVLPTETNANVYNLPNGSYTYTVTKLGFDAASGNFTVNNAAVTLAPITLTGAATYTVTLTFKDEMNASVTPSSVTVKHDGETVDPNTTGGTVYTLPNGTYSYVVDDPVYYKVEDTFTVNGADLPVSVTLETNKTWDGTTKTPVTPTEGVYEISTAAELAWFAAQVNAGNTTYNAKLTANIYVNYNGSNNAWTPIGSYNKQYAGTFDGNGKAIRGLNAALFAYNATGSMVKNLTVYGSNSGESNVGGVCNASYGSFENCVSYMNITATGQRVGGIVGVLYADGSVNSIKKCVNHGAITSSYSGFSDSTMASVGGIVGMCYVPVEQCYNTGEVSATSDSYGSAAVGGIVGYLNKAALTHCYNTGTVKAAHRAGGLVGVAENAAATVTNSYNVGTITVVGSAENPYCGAVAGELKNSASVSNCYFLAGSYTYAKGSHTDEAVGNPAATDGKKTASEMKLDSFAIALSPTAKAFNMDSSSINDGYPILSWQGGTAPTVSQDEQDVAAAKAALCVEPSTITAAMTLTLPTTGANGTSISWESSHSSLIATNGVVTLPTDNDTTVTLTATIQKGSVTDTKTFTLVVKTQASADQTALEAIKAKLGTSFRVAYQSTAPNVISAVQAKLSAAIAAAGVSGLTADQITVTLENAGQTIYGSQTLIAADGTVTYYYEDPAKIGAANGDATVSKVQFKLSTASGASVTTGDCVVAIPWDQVKVKAAMQAGVDTLTFDTIKGENTASTSVTKALSLVKQLTNYGWMSIEWDSSNEDVISLSGGESLTPYVGNVTPAENDTEVTLTATFFFNKNNSDSDKDGYITVTKEIKVTVPGASNTYMDTIDAALANFKLENLKYAMGANKGQVIDSTNVTDSISLPLTSVLGIDGGTTDGYKVEYSASVDGGASCPVTVNGYRANVMRPLGNDKVTVKLKLTLTKQTGGVLQPAYSKSKELSIQIAPIPTSEIDAELALLNQVKAAYFTGINDNRNVSKDAVTTNLHPFQEAYLDAAGKLTWIYTQKDCKDIGIVPSTVPGGTETTWNLFKSSNASVVKHENLVVTQPTTENAAVTLTSRLKSYRLGGYYEFYKDGGCDAATLAKLKTLSGDETTEVSVTVTVISTQNAAKAKAVSDALDALLPVTAETSKDTIAQIEANYQALDANTKQLLPPDTAATIRQAYADQAALSAAAEQTKKDKAAAAAVDAKIEALPTTVTLQSESAITQARKAYEDLSDAAKTHVTKLSKLTQAENDLNELKNAQGYTAQLASVLAFIKSSVDTPVANASIKGEWAVLSAARAGMNTTAYTNWYAAYAQKLGAKLQASRGSFDTTNEYARIVLALTAMGQNAKEFKFGGTTYDLVTPLTAKTGDTYKATIPGRASAAFALIALDSGDYSVTDTSARSALVAYLVTTQKSSGAWSIDDTNFTAENLDTTAMVLTALARHTGEAGVSTAIDKALTYLAQKQGANGYGSTESNAQVITALSALGIDCTMGDFAKQGSNPLTAMLKLQLASGGFKQNSTTTSANQMSSEQAAYALVAYDRFKRGTNSLYNMSDAQNLLPQDNHAQAVIDQINDLGTITNCNRSTYLALEAIKAAYDALDRSEKEEVTNYNDYLAQKTRFDSLLQTHLTAKLKELEEHYGKLKQSDFTTEQWKKITEAYRTGRSEISASAYAEQADTALDKAKDAIDAYVNGDVITVSFRLVGDFPESYTGEHISYVNWIATSEYTLKTGSTVYDLFTSALSNAGLQSIGADTGYVSSITAPSVLGGYTLSEFSNGPGSGWMFTVNNVHGNYALNEHVLQDGDRVVWHYVDSYANEENRFTWLEAEDITPLEYVQRHISDVAVAGKHGSIDPQLTVSDLGKRVTFKFTPDKGYRVRDVKVNGVSVGAVESYTLQDVKIYSRITVEFTNGALPFTDVLSTDWFYDDVVFAYENGLFSGTSATTFSPNAPMTRAMLVTVLYRLEGEPTVFGRSGFADVVRSSYYEDAVTWAAENNIVNGTSHSAFSPEANVTREQMAAILYRYTQYRQLDITGKASLAGFADAARVSGYAETSMQWAVGEGLINGAGGNLMPAGAATRAQVAAILHRFVENIAQ